MRKTVYIAINDKNQTLYNKNTGTWNDGTGKRDGSSVWTFSSKKPKEESETIIKAAQHLANLGFENVTFQLAEVEIDEKGRARVVVDEVPFGNEEQPAEAEMNDGEWIESAIAGQADPTAEDLQEATNE